MRVLFGSALSSRENYFIARRLSRITIRNAAIFILLVFLFTGCKKQDVDPPVQDDTTTDHTMHTNTQFSNHYRHIGLRTLWELLQARLATARYQHISNAIADGYEDIHVEVENMGHHYMKVSLSDAVFDYKKPEILVYNKRHNGTFQLVAVEYAVPLHLSPNAPAGFTGSADVWDRNTVFNLWLLHAWIWAYNPDGVFNPTNPLVHLH